MSEKRYGDCYTLDEALQLEDSSLVNDLARDLIAAQATIARVRAVPRYNSLPTGTDSRSEKLVLAADLEAALGATDE